MPVNYFDTHESLTLKRGKERRMNHHNIIVETLRELEDEKPPTKDELQKHSRIRRVDFILMLKSLLETKSVERIGAGTKFDPFRYVLGEKQRQD